MIVALLFVLVTSLSATPASIAGTANGLKRKTPHITTQPASQTVTAGNPVTFWVSVTSTTPLNYQWKKNDAFITGATSSTYSTPATISSDSGAQFTVVVSNAAGSATSSVAILTVTAATTLLLNSSVSSLNFGNVNVSTSSSQNITLTNAGNANVTISQVMVSGAGFNTSGGAAGLILSPGQTTALSVNFAPSASGVASGTVTVSSNATNSPVTIGLTGTGVTPVSHSISLSWTEGTIGVTGYNAYVGSVSGGPYLHLTSSPLTVNSYADTSVQSGQTYYYVVTALDSTNQESTYSSEVVAVVP
jgi:hypothetical protein